MLKQPVFIIIAIAFSSAIHAQRFSTEGKEFWVSFMRNTGIFEDPEILNLKLFIHPKQTGTIRLQNADRSYDTSFAIPAGETIEVKLPPKYFYQYVREKIEKRGLWITATVPINLYASNQTQYSSDVATIIPVTSLGREYMILDYSGGEKNRSQCLIVATEDGTTVEIAPSSHASPTQKQPFTIVLNRGESYLYTSSLNLTGTVVKSLEDCKKIAVFTGNECAEVPVGCEACDHLFEQNFPINTKGSKYLLAPGFQRESDRVLVAAIHSGTAIRINKGAVIELQQGAFLDTALSEAMVIETNLPVQVAQLARGYKCESSNVGDPFMMYITPVEGIIEESNFVSMQEGHIQEHYLNIYLEADDTAQLQVDGKKPVAVFKPFPSDPKYVHATIKLSKGGHTLSCPGGTLAYAYGYGMAESYGYCVKTNYFQIDQSFIIDTISTLKTDTVRSCENKTHRFTAQIKDEGYSKLFWLIDEITRVENSLSFERSFANAGYHKVQMIVTYGGPQSKCAASGNAEVTDTTIAYVLVEPYQGFSLGQDIVRCNQDDLNSSIELHPDALIDGATYTWSTGESTNNITVSSYGTYWLQAAYGACITKDTVVIKNEIVRASAGKDTIALPNEPFFLNGWAVGNDLTYQWLPTDGIVNSREQRPLVSISKDMTYSLTVASAYGCILRDTVTVKLLSIDDVFIPSAFTPNNDHLNDEIRPILPKSTLLDFSIFNRWGKLVFKTSDHLKGWNGKVNGVPQPPGLYVYVVTARSADGSIRTKKGSFVLMK